MYKSTSRTIKTYRGTNNKIISNVDNFHLMTYELRHRTNLIMQFKKLMIFFVT